MPDRQMILDALKRLFAPEFKEIAFRFGMPPEHWRDGAQSEQAIEIIRYAEAHNRLPELAGLLNLPAAQPEKRFFLVSGPANPYFTGRTALLEHLHATLQNQRCAGLYGLGGMGKTQTALRYAHLHRQDYRAVLWVSAETPGRLQAELSALTAPLGLPVAQEQARNVATVLNWLGEADLLILDNADEPDSIKAWLPATARVLLTSRAPNLRPLAEPLEVLKLEPDEAAQFLWKRGGRGVPGAGSCDQAEYAAARELAQTLDGLPLALDQAAAYIHENSTTFRDYLALYQKHALALLKERGQTAFDSDHPLPVAATWQPSLDKILVDSPETVDLLYLCAFLDADQIPEEIPRRAFSMEDERAWNALLKPALRYSLLRRAPQSKLLSLHRLVQLVLRSLLDETAQREWAERAVLAVAEEFPKGDIEFEDWPRCARLLSCALQCAEWGKVHFHVRGEYVLLLNQVAFYLDGQASYNQSLFLYELALKITENILGLNHPHVASILDNIASVYFSKGEYEQAQNLYQRALEIREEALGIKHLDTATTLNNLGELHRAKGEYIDSLKRHEMALTIRKNLLGSEHLLTAQSINNLALLYKAQGNYDHAILLCRQALKITKNKLGLKHPSTAIDINNLAELYRVQEKYKKSLKLHLLALEIRKSAFGSEHPNVAQSLNNIALVYQEQCRYKEAAELYEISIKISESKLGLLHPDTANYINNLAELHHSQGKYDLSLILHNKALKIKESIFGKIHPQVAASLNNIGKLYEAQGEYAKALPLLVRSVSILEETLPSGHPWVVKVRKNLAAARKRAEEK